MSWPETVAFLGATITVCASIVAIVGMGVWHERESRETYYEDDDGAR